MENALRIVYIGNSAEALTALRAEKRVSVTVQGNLLAAENYLQSGQVPDAILCEMTISGGDGLAMHEWVRKRRELDSICFLLLDTVFNQEVYKESVRKQVDDFYLIPLPPLESLVNRILFLREYRKKLKPVEPQLSRDITYTMPTSKRLFDLIVAFGGMVVLSPLLLIVSVVILLESKGNVLYVTKRIGSGGRIFDYLKFRTMHQGADSESAYSSAINNWDKYSLENLQIDFEKPCPNCSQLRANTSCSPLIFVGTNRICEYWYSVQTKEIAKARFDLLNNIDDLRVTKVGKILRQTGIDRLPQLINVLKGDMSIVGNQPLRLYEAEMLTKGDTSRRFFAPAGMTGLYQIELRNKDGNMSAAERIMLDVAYSDHFIGNNYSFWYDLNLLLRSFR
jgi:lipopolysaccharide/colanic/teichoic acid biosynthesis glycosyltransferase/CheY-like chemotaxis protein